MREETASKSGASNNSSFDRDDVKLGSSSQDDEEFVGPEFEEDAYYSSLAATPSFDDFEASDSEEILVHWHHESGEIEEIAEADFAAAGPEPIRGAEVVRSTRGELRRLRSRLRARLLGLVRGDLLPQRSK